MTTVFISSLVSRFGDNFICRGEVTKDNIGTRLWGHIGLSSEQMKTQMCVLGNLMGHVAC